ncbi:MAG: DUF4249 family protein [Gilvibacter sp.]
MKHVLSIILVCTFLSCQDVVEIDVPSEDPRLIVDAVVRIDTNLAITEVKVIVSETNAFFETIAPTNLQQITLSNLDNPVGGDGIVLVEEEPGSGIYVKSLSTLSLIQDRWLLQIDFEDRFYLAEASFQPAPDIDSLTIGDGTLFGDDETEIIVSYTDIPEQENYYIFDFGFNEFLATEDTFYQDQDFEFSFFYDQIFEPGTELTVSILGSDKDFYEYFDELIVQSDDSGNPFQTPTVTVRGNIINVTDIDNDGTFDNVGDQDNFALGYFALVQEFKKTVVTE